MKIIANKMRFQVIEMAPEYAQELLDKNHPSNRSVKRHRIEQYERDIKAGLWRLTHQAIAVDEDGYLVDGQNRLSAIIRSGQSVPVVLCTGVPRDAILGADCGAVRNVSDAARICGKPMPHGALGFASVAKAMMSGINRERKPMSHQQILEFVDSHKAALEFAFAVLPKNVRFLTQASVRAVVARAYYKRNSRNRIREFGEVYMSGLCNNTKFDMAAIRLRNWISETMSSRRGGNRPQARTVYAKTSTALRHFIDCNPIDALRETSEELFPLETDDVEEQEEHDSGKTNGRLVGV